MRRSEMSSIDELKNIIYYLMGKPGEKRERTEKGRSLLQLPKDFTVIDLETTGLMPGADRILEVGALRVRDGAVSEKYQSLVRYDDDCEVDPFITELTGITTDMIKSAPDIQDILPEYLSFIGSDVVVGHNVNFDINFIYDEASEICGRSFTNDFVDTMRLSRRVHPEERHHRLQDLVDRYHITQDGQHRSLADCSATLQCYRCLSEEIDNGYGGVEHFTRVTSHKSVKAADFTGDAAKNDPSSPLYQKVCVVTGKLERFTRAEAMQLIADLGGINGDTVTKNTNYLVLGNNDYCKTIKGGKSNKQKKAEDLKSKGYDIEIIPESVFYDMILQDIE